jgi:arylsulfatase A
MNMRLLLFALTLVVGLAGSFGTASDTKPNIVFFLVDDLGWGAMSAYGNTYHETPAFDRLCDRGMRFTNAYSACTVCSPSRAAILTGRYPARLHLTDWIAGHKHPKAKLAVPDWTRQIDHNLVTLPETLKEHGYQTWFLGKWHLMPIYDEWSKEKTIAEQAGHTPQAHGFDVNIGGREWGQPKGRGKYFYPFDMPGLESGEQGEYLTDRLTDEAVHLIENSGDRPFLLYMSYYTVHTPIMGKPEYNKHFAEKRANMNDAPTEKGAAAYAAMHKSLDDSVGRIVEKLKEVGAQDNTVLVFTGDNGGDRHYACGGLRGRKGLAYEGGVREPTCVVWPGHTQPGSVCDTPIIGMDFYPTLIDIAGIAPKTDQHCDGVNLRPLLEQTGGIDRHALYWHYPHYHRTAPYTAIRDGEWKLIEFHEEGDLHLFNLADDPQEQRDLASSKPEKAQLLRAKLRGWREEVGAQMPTPNPDYVP